MVERSDTHPTKIRFRDLAAHEWALDDRLRAPHHLEGRDGWWARRYRAFAHPTAAVDLIHRNVTASRICTMRNKLMHECALFDLALALTSAYL